MRRGQLAGTGDTFHTVGWSGVILASNCVQTVLTDNSVTKKNATISNGLFLLLLILK